MYRINVSNIATELPQTAIAALKLKSSESCYSSLICGEMTKSVFYKLIGNYIEKRNLHDFSKVSYYGSFKLTKYATDRNYQSTSQYRDHCGNERKQAAGDQTGKRETDRDSGNVATNQCAGIYSERLFTCAGGAVVFATWRGRY